jgi:hypothetical protein
MRGGELGFFDHSFGVTVDEPLDPTSQGGRLPIEPGDFLGHDDAISRRGEATAILVFHPRWVFQQCSHLVPYDLFEPVGAHRLIGARRRAAETIPFGAAALIISQFLRRIFRR